MSTTPHPALVNLGLALAAAPPTYNAAAYLYKELRSAYHPLDALLDLRHLSSYLYLIALSVAILLSGAVARRAGLAGALIARAGWIQGFVFCALLSAIVLLRYLEYLRLSDQDLQTLVFTLLPMAIGFGLVLRFVEPLTLDQTPLRIVPARLRAGIALSTLMMLTELHGMLFYVLTDTWSAQHVPLLALAGSIIVAFGAIVRGRRWGFVLHVVNLALMASIAIAQLLGWDTLFGELAPLLLLSLGVQAIPYLAMLRGDMWRDDAPDLSSDLVS